MGLAGPDLLVILIVALIIFGPRKLPDLGKKLGEGMAQFRRASDEFKRTWEAEVQNEKYRIQPARPAYVQPTAPIEPMPAQAEAPVADTQPITSPIPEGADEEHAAAMLLGTVPSIDPSTRVPAPEPAVKEVNQDWM